jgi:hypothetical protein
MDQLTPNSVLKSVLAFRREGGVALVDFDTVDGEKVTFRFDVRYLWSVAADMRAASIDLIAPVPEALKAALGDGVDAGEDEDQDEGKSEKKQPAADAPDGEQPRTGFAGLEQVWTLCDALNNRQLTNPGDTPEAVFAHIASGHFLLDPDARLLPLADPAGYEVHLKNEFKIVYRNQTNDWIPDRRDRPAEPGAEVS